MAATRTDPEKTVDLPPYGSRNPDPATDQPGSHPIETGVGAVLGGVATGLALGTVGGPVGAVIGGIIGGAAAGGLAGKGVGELIDPTTEDNWLREYVVTAGDGPDAAEAYRPAYRHGITAAADAPARSYAEVEGELRTRYESTRTADSLPWESVRGAVQDAYDRTLKLHAERLKTDTTERVAEEVRARVQVVTEERQITVPVRKEVLVIERLPVWRGTEGTSRGVAAPSAEPVRIQLREERVNVTKEVVVYEEVVLSKRAVTEQKTAAVDLLHEELVVDGVPKPTGRSGG